MNVQIGRIELSMADLFLYENKVHVSDVSKLAQKYNAQIQHELSSNTDYPHHYFVIIDGIKFYGCFKEEQIDWID